MTRAVQLGVTSVFTALLAMGGALALPSPAVGQGSESGYAQWTIEGSSGAYSGTMTLPPGFPAATWTSDSIGPASVPSGASAWIPETVDFGSTYGSSRGQQYVNLRPAANSADSPSTTTYEFASPTPASGWGIAVGDIDADIVEVSATDPGGNPVPGAGLGFQSAFNYCDASPRSSACSGEPDPGSGQFDVPTAEVRATSVVLTGNFDDHTGPSGWFQPTVPLSTLTIEMTWQVGFPVYQTWFATELRTISGTVTRDQADPEPGVLLTLLDPDGNELATTTTGSDGTYSFTGLGPVDGYTVVMTPPPGLQPVGPVSRPADLAAADATDVDFDLTLGTPIIEKSADVTEARPGDVVSYTIKARVTDTEVIDTTIVDDLAGVLDNATYNGDVTASAGTVAVDDAAAELTWTGSIAVGEEVVITYSVTTTGAGELANVVVGSDESSCPPTGGTPDCAVTVPVKAPVPPVEPTNGPVLPVTGGVTGPLVLAGAGLVALGAAAMAATVRRRWRR